MWLNTGNACCGGAADTAPFIVFDLEGVYQVDSIRVWNYNEVNLPGRGISTANISVSTDNSTFTPLGTFSFNQAPGTTTTDSSQVIDLTSNPTARYVRFDTLDNFAGGDNEFVASARSASTPSPNRPPAACSRAGWEPSPCAAGAAPSPAGPDLQTDSGPAIARGRRRSRPDVW